MKLYTKVEKILDKYGEFWAIVFLIITGLNTLVYFPFPKKEKKAIIDNIELETRSYIGRNSSFYYEVFVFHIDNKEYTILQTEDDETYDYLKGVEVLFTYDTKNDISKIVYNGEVLFYYNYINKFYKWLVLFILSLSLCIWIFIIRVKKIVKSNKKIENDDIEEYFYDSWSIAKKNNFCTLSYISKIDNSLKRIKITNDEFILAKQREIGLEYNLW